MSRTLERARIAIVLLGLAPVFALPAVGEDFAGWSDNEVNAALANTRLQLPDPHLTQSDLTLCPTMVAGDTASAIDCEVNEALSARLGVSQAADAFLTIHMDNQKANSAGSANWRPLTTGSLSTGQAKPVTAEGIDYDPCAPGLMTIQGDTEHVTCEWAVAE